MSDAENEAAAPAAGAEGDPAERIAALERRLENIDRLTRFQVDAYKKRLAEMKQTELRQRAEILRLRRRLAALSPGGGGAE